MLQPVQQERRPAAARVASRIRHAVQEGKYLPEAPLPSYRDFAGQYGVSVWTVRAAFDILEAEGILSRHERRGTFLRDSRPATPEPGKPATLRCINFVSRYEWESFAPQYQFMRADYLLGYTEALEHEDAKTRFASFTPGSEQYERLFSPRFGIGEQGCILHNLADKALLQWLHDRRVPAVVQYHCAYPREGLPDHYSVFENKTAGAFEATNYLLRLGHRRIGFIGALPGHQLLSAVYDGYRSALGCAGLEPRAADLMNLASDVVAEALGPAHQCLSRPERPTAILAQTDSTAMALLQAAKSLGIRVPQDLSIVGFNDQPGAAETDPPLTTVSVPRRQLARTAVQVLFKAARGDFETPRVCALECHLVVRASAAEAM